MAAPPSSSAPPSTADTLTSSSKPFLPSPSSAIRSPIFSPQPLLGKPLNPPPPPPPPPLGILYPVASAAVHRGFPLRSAAAVRAVDQLVTVANPSGYLRSSSPMAVMNFAAAMAAASQARPYVYGGVEHTAAAAASHGMRPPPSQGQQLGHHFVVPRPGTPRGPSAPAHPKVTSLPSIPSAPEHSDTKERDKSIDDPFVMIHGRKVRVVDDGSCSLYTLCRSWIQSGLTQETHVCYYAHILQNGNMPNAGEGVKLLPKPLPPSIVEEMLNKKLDGKGDEDFQEDERGDSVDQLSSQELLAGHIRRAKRVRARFRRERLLRIERYKQRLSLLLPAPNDLGQANTTLGNS